MSISTNTPFGLAVLRRYDGGVAQRYSGDYTIANAYSAAIGFGDVVISTDNWQQVVTTGQVVVQGPQINIGATTNKFLGVFQGCSYQDPLGNFIWAKNWIASTSTQNSAGAQANVIVDPKTVYQIQADAAVAATDIGKFMSLASIGSPNTLGVSQMVAHVAGLSTSITDLKILNFVQNAGLTNNTSAAYPLLEVLLAECELSDPISNG